MVVPAVVSQVEIHEIEERKNLHINDLIRSHEASFAEIKKYYNNITKDNLKLIRLLKVRACTAGYLSFGPMALCVVHALKGLACRASHSRACFGLKNSKS